MKNASAISLLAGLFFSIVLWGVDGPDRAHDSPKESPGRGQGHEDRHDESHASGVSEGHGEGGDHHEEEALATDKAIQAVQDGGNRFQLSTEAEQILKLKRVPVIRLKEDRFKVPLSAIVNFEDRSGVYLHDGQWFRFVEVQVIRRNNLNVEVKAKFPSEASVVSQGTPLLRVAHLEASGRGGQGHAH